MLLLPWHCPSCCLFCQRRPLCHFFRPSCWCLYPPPFCLQASMQSPCLPPPSNFQRCSLPRVLFFWLGFRLVHPCQPCESFSCLTQLTRQPWSTLLPPPFWNPFHRHHPVTPCPSFPAQAFLPLPFLMAGVSLPRAWFSQLLLDFSLLCRQAHPPPQPLLRTFPLSLGVNLIVVLLGRPLYQQCSAQAALSQPLSPSQPQPEVSRVSYPCFQLH